MKIKIKSLVISHWSLVIILVLAAALRLYKLNTVPPGLSPDEASLGYSAYSILKTGKDEYGKLLPVIFKSFGDYKPGLYVYTAVPFIAVFGLNEWAVRLPSAIAGVLSILLVYLIIKEFNNLLKAKNDANTSTTYLEIVATLVAATNPWLIYFSRGAWEANLSLTLTLVGIYFFLKSLKSLKYLIFTSIFFSLTLWTYQGAKLSTLIVIIILLITFWKEVKVWFDSEKIQIVKSLAVGIILSIPVLLSFINGQTGRLDVFSIFSYPRPQGYTQDLLNEGQEKIGDLNYYLYHSETFNFFRGIAGRWFNHFSGKFLFFEGDYQNPRHSAPNSGMLLLIDLLFIPFGLVFLVKNKSKFSNFILLWLLLSPLPEILSRDQVHAVRALNMSIPFILVSSLGLSTLIGTSSKFRFKFLSYLLISTFYGITFIYFLDSYFIHIPIHNAKYWQYGYKEVVEKITPIQDNYYEIIFQQSYSQPYIYFLFYQKYDPVKYQQKDKLVNEGPDVGLVDKLDNISFINYSWPPPIHEGKTLVIGSSAVLPDFYANERFDLLSEIKNPDQFTIAFRILEKKI